MAAKTPGFKELLCIRGSSAGREVLLGFAPASLLHSLSFADVLNEDTSRGYQRRINSQHSLDFRRYIQQSGSSTIPLTFNLRPQPAGAWHIEQGNSGCVTLAISADHKPMAQVDCQHRLAHMEDLDIELPFMCFIGLTEREEMEVFNVINGKARGLSSSLLDFHDAQLATDLGADRPELYISLFMRREATSPWHNQLDLGGTTTSGMGRRASLRTFQKAVHQFLNRTKVLDARSIDDAAHLILDFWGALVTVLPEQWQNPRKHMLTKGVGVYALMEIAADLFVETPKGRVCDRKYFVTALSDFAPDFDWETRGPLKGLGGQGGVKKAVELIRAARRTSRLRVVGNGK
ncbi:MAG: DGQHR domain-containing protein [Chromatiales bacterium]|nr:DGQHR domain-containing protein [Chromatiales bacterium]